MTIETENKCVEVLKSEDMAQPIQSLFDDLLSFISLNDWDFS